jgi:hypothetical protein
MYKEFLKIGLFIAIVTIIVTVIGPIRCEFRLGTGTHESSK